MHLPIFFLAFTTGCNGSGQSQEKDITAHHSHTQSGNVAQVPHGWCSDAEGLEQRAWLVSSALAAAIRACSMSGLETELLCPASLSALGVLTSCRTKLVKESVEGWLVIAADKTTSQLYTTAGRATKAATSAMVSLILIYVYCLP